jgi:signal transduction histidine kinase
VFEQIINNLLSNAISYSDEKSEISIVFKRTGDYAQLQITNMTSELEQSDMPLIFDRLWRKSKSRSSSEHSGLGLPLVKAYAELLSLKVKADLSDNKKFMISIENLHIV